MITLKIKRVIKKSIELFFAIFFIVSIIGFITLARIAIKSETPKVTTIINNSSSIIYDSSGLNISTINLVNNNSVEYKDLPDVFINALISAEDARFFSHSGVDFQRIISAFINNATSSTTQGASTLTQQLIKNIYLDSSKTLDRKINEIIMALELENKMSKEDILLAYANNIMFDGTTIGVNNASLKLFSKPINNVNLAESALLAGLVNAPSYYNPLKNPANAKERMDTVLNLMYRHGYITKNQLNDAKAFQINDLINLKEYEETSYPYQSYLDIVYKEVMELTGYNPLTTPLIIETYMDTDLQALIDSIQNNQDSSIRFTDDNQQIAMSVVDNENGALIAAGGGRNYNGQLLFNRATDMQNQPASTIKPLLSYALAIEHLNWNNKQVVNDEPYTYPGTTTTVNNVDHTYMGEMLIEEAIGYSRNTTALKTLEKVIEKTGINTVINYLKDINLLDVDSNNFNLSYGLGAMQYGVSPTQLASAYSMLAREGCYSKAYTVKRITLQKTNQVIYTHIPEKKQILSKETAFIISDILKNVVENNYYNLGTVKVDGVEMHAKTGTSSFDSKLLKELNYPSDASKDIWMAGYSADFTTIVWSGFDYPEKGKENYFKSGNDSRKYISRKVFKKIMDYQSQKGKTIKLPDTLVGVNVVRGTNLLPDAYTPMKLINTVYYKKGEEPTQKISPPKLDDVTNINLMLVGDSMTVSFKDDIFDIVDVVPKANIIDYSSIYGKTEYVIEITNENNVTNTYTSFDSSFTFNLYDTGYLKIKAYTRYANIKNITSNIYETSYYSIFTF